MPSWIPKLLKTPDEEMPVCLLCTRSGPPLEDVYLGHCVHPACRDEMLAVLREKFSHHTKAQLKLMLTVALKDRAQKAEAGALVTSPPDSGHLR